MFQVEKTETLKNNMIPDRKNWRYELSLCDDEEYYDMECDLDPEDEEFVIISFKHCTYRLIHGFPGDNPIGIIVDENNNIIDTCGELSMEHYDGDEKSKSIIAWYEIITKDGTDYFSDFWYIEDRNDEPPLFLTELEQFSMGNNGNCSDFLFSINLKNIDFPEDVKLQEQWKHFLRIDNINNGWELKSGNYKIFAFEEINYLLIHGNRDGEEIGIIVDENKNIVDLCCNLPQISRFRGDKTSNLILNWYNMKTNEFSDYSSNIWKTE